jgi:hypothetical protein
MICISQLQSRLIQTCNLFAAYASRLAKTAGKLNSAVDLAIADGEDLSTVSVKEEDEFLKKFELNLYVSKDLISDCEQRLMTVFWSIVINTRKRMPIQSCSMRSAIRAPYLRWSSNWLRQSLNQKDLLKCR